jgi:hypothetical protein
MTSTISKKGSRKIFFMIKNKKNKTFRLRPASRMHSASHEEARHRGEAASLI